MARCSGQTRASAASGTAARPAPIRKRRSPPIRSAWTIASGTRITG